MSQETSLPLEAMKNREDVARLASDPNARVLVFVDGQNLYKRCEDLFGHPLCYPRKLAEELAGPRNKNPVSIRYYTGRPSPNINAAEARKAATLDRRLAAMEADQITVVRRQLRYHWAWGHRQNLPRPTRTSPPQTVTMRPWQRPQEKGIDLILGLDVVEFILTGVCDVAIVVSLDRDLAEIPIALRTLAKLRKKKPYRLEAAVPVADGRRHPKQLAGFNYTHQITRVMFERCRDNTDYSRSRT